MNDTTNRVFPKGFDFYDDRELWEMYDDLGNEIHYRRMEKDAEVKKFMTEHQNDNMEPSV